MASRLGLIFERQWLHALCLAALITSVVWVGDHPSVQAGRLWGISSGDWLSLAVGVAVLHQVFVWFSWRTQLHAALLTRVFGSRAFGIHAVLFSIIGITRVTVVFILAISNRGSVESSPAVLRALAVAAAIPVAYLLYSVLRYFGLRRALGIDHFDASYRSRPFVKQGIYRVTSNGMYVLGFLVLWVPGLWYASAAALCAAAFNHVYVWVHYVATELPDIRRIYGDGRRSAPVR